MAPAKGPNPPPPLPIHGYKKEWLIIVTEVKQDVVSEQRE